MAEPRNPRRRSSPPDGGRGGAPEGRDGEGVGAARPIIFSTPMVRAILRAIEKPGTGKTQTRRVLKARVNAHGRTMWPCFSDGVRSGEMCYPPRISMGEHGKQISPTTVRHGDRLWVRETLRANSNDQGARWYGYAADGKDVWPTTEWLKPRDSVPSIHMPRWASRLTLIVTDVRVQRLQDITEADAVAEGAIVPSAVGPHYTALDRPFGKRLIGTSAYRLFGQIWDSINADRGYGWDANPWVAAYTFTPVLGNIDRVMP